MYKMYKMSSFNRNIHKINRIKKALKAPLHIIGFLYRPRPPEVAAGASDSEALIAQRLREPDIEVEKGTTNIFWSPHIHQN